MTRSSELANKLKELADKNQIKLWELDPKLVESIYFTVGWLQGISQEEFEDKS